MTSLQAHRLYYDHIPVNYSIFFRKQSVGKSGYKFQLQDVKPFFNTSGIGHSLEGMKG